MLEVSVPKSEKLLSKRELAVLIDLCILPSYSKYFSYGYILVKLSPEPWMPWFIRKERRRLMTLTSQDLSMWVDEYIGNFESCWAETGDLSRTKRNQGRCISTDSNISSVLRLSSWVTKGSFSINYNWGRFKPWVSAATTAQHPAVTCKVGWNGF